MTRLHKVRTIATFEFLTAVKRPGYLIATFGMPLFVAAYGAIVAIPAYFAAQKDKADALFGVVDQAAVLAQLSHGRRASAGLQHVEADVL